MHSRDIVRRLARRGRIVIKVGSGVLTGHDGRLDPKTVRRLATEIAPITGTRRWPYVVSSGAIAVGMGILGLSSRPRTMPGLQAAAALGQGKLVEAWSKSFSKFDLHVAQVLLTHADLSNRRRFLNARHALLELERRKSVAVINENDTVSFEEIAVGDNDELAAHVSNLVDAKMLILLSVARGIQKPDGSVVDVALASDTGLDELVTPAKSKTGVGGMQSKLKAARIAAARGSVVAIVDGKEPNAIFRLLEGEPIGTVLLPKDDATPLDSRAHWIAHTLRPRGTLSIDPGAVTALRRNNTSLLPSGIVEARGSFDEGDPVDIVDHANGHVLARGLSRYGADAVRNIAGCKSHEIEGRLGYTLGSAVVHRDDLVVLNPPARGS